MKRSLSILAGMFLSVFLANDGILAALAPDATRTVAGGGVTVKITYLGQTERDSRFSVVLDTHSVNLDMYDLKALSFMRDDTGLTTAPTGAENKGSGHHREIVLTFSRSSERKWLELVIKDLAGVKERTFRWNRE